jgi:hypothetical protein
VSTAREQEAIEAGLIDAPILKDWIKPEAGLKNQDEKQRVLSSVSRSDNEALDRFE